MAFGRRAFVVGTLVAGCTQRATVSPNGAPTSSSAPEPGPPSTEATPPTETTPPTPRVERPASKHALFDAYPSLARALARIELGRFPSQVEVARGIGDGIFVKRDDDFTRSASWDPSCDVARIFGGGKVRKLELFFGEARALGKRRLVTTGGVGSNQALAVALLGRALGFEVAMFLAPQPASDLTAKNLAADAASRAEMRLEGSVHEAHARALREAKERGDTYVIPPGGTPPLGTLGFVNAGLELADDVAAGRLPAPRRLYVALGLGGTAAGLGIGCALGGLDTEIVAVRTSGPSTVTAATLRAIHDETIAFARARDPSFPALSFARAHVRIDGRFLGGGYGVPTDAGRRAIARGEREGWSLDPVYTGKAFAALLDDERTGGDGGALFWNTASSRPLVGAAVPAPFDRFLR